MIFDFCITPFRIKNYQFKNYNYILSLSRRSCDCFLAKQKFSEDTSQPKPGSYRAFLYTGLPSLNREGPFFYKDKTWRRLSPRPAISSLDSEPASLINRALSTARIWSHTATTFFPRQTTGTTIGCLGLPAVEIGITTTMRRA